jgi:hypothetical protein
MTKTSSLRTSADAVHTWDKAGGKNTQRRWPAKSKSLNGQARYFEAAMAADKQQNSLSKKKRDCEAVARQTKILNELDERGDFFDGMGSSDDARSGFRKQDDLEAEHGYAKREELAEPPALSELMLRFGHQVEPSDAHAPDQQPRVDFQRYQDIIEKIEVSRTLPDGPKDVKIEFSDETLNGAQVTISKSGDRVKIRWLTGSGSVYRLLAKQRFELQQHLYRHLGIKSDVAVDFKKELRPRLDRKKNGLVQRGSKTRPVDAR